MTELSAPSKALFSRAELFLILALSTVQFTHIVDFMIMMPLGPQLMRVFAINPHQFGLLVSAYTFAAAMSGVTAAFFIDRFDRKRALLFFFAGFAVGTLACGLAPNYEFLLLARLLTGVFGGVLGSLVLSIVGDAIETARRGSAMGLVMAAFSVASIFGVPFSIFLATRLDWHAPFFFLGGLAAVLWMVLNFSLPPLRGHLARYKPRSFAKTVNELVTDRNQMVALTYMFCLIFGQFSIIPFLSPSFVSNAGLPEADLPLIYLVGGCVSIVSAPLIGRLADRIGKHRVFMISALLSIGPILMVTNLGPTPKWQLLLGVACFFAVIGGRMIPAMAMVTGVVPPESRGSFMSFVSSTQQMASALASYVAGVIVFHSPEGVLMNYQYVGYIAVVFSCLAIFLSTRLRFS